MNDGPPSDSAFLRQARQYVRDRRERGVICPCCGQLAKTYRRALNANMARALIWLHRVGLRDGGYHRFQDAPADIVKSREGGKLAHWGLIEEKPNDDPDKRHSGAWRTTSLGDRFVQGQVLVEKYVHLYDNHVVGQSGPPISIVMALGTKFSYGKLMRGGSV